MTKHFCDACSKEITGRTYSVLILCHIKASVLDHGGHVQVQDDGSVERISGREEKTDLCLPCYNKIMYPLWESIKKIQNKN